MLARRCIHFQGPQHPSKGDMRHGAHWGVTLDHVARAKSVRPVRTPRIHRTKNPKSRVVGESESFRGNPPLEGKKMLESNLLKSRFLVHGLTVHECTGVYIMILCFA